MDRSANALQGNENITCPLNEYVRSPLPVLGEQFRKNSVQNTHGAVTIIIIARKRLGFSYANSVEILRTVAPHLFMAFPSGIYMDLLEQSGR